MSPSDYKELALNACRLIGGYIESYFKGKYIVGYGLAHPFFEVLKAEEKYADSFGFEFSINRNDEGEFELFLFLHSDEAYEAALKWSRKDDSYFETTPMGSRKLVLSYGKKDLVFAVGDMAESALMFTIFRLNNMPKGDK